MEAFGVPWLLTTTSTSSKGLPYMKLAPNFYRAQRRRIERRFRKTRDQIEAMRCRILLLCSQGHPVKAITQIVGCARATVYRTVYRFQELGEAGISDLRLEPEPRKVTPSTISHLLSLLEKSPRDFGWQRSTWTLELLARQVEELTRVQLSLSHIRNMLLSAGCRRGRPRPGLRIPFKGRRDILDAIRGVVASASGEDEVFYVDEADIDLNPRIGACYMRRGRQHVVLTPGKNEKRYVAGALNARTGRVVYWFSQRKNSALFLSLLEILMKSYRKARRLHLILDNYSIHKSRLVKSWQGRLGSRIVMHFLPPYSPEANMIEHLWKQMHDHVTRNHRFTKMEDLMKAVVQFLASCQPFPGTKVSTMKMAA
jgi:putative transposase